MRDGWKGWPMVCCGSVLFTDANQYEAHLPGKAGLYLMRRGKFGARLTWVKVGQLSLVHAEENFPRLVQLTVPTRQIMIVFPTQRNATLICDGVPLGSGDVIIHKGRRSVYQRTTGAVGWSSIAVPATALRNYGKTLLGQDVVPSSHDQILRPAANDWRPLLRLHAEAIRIAETQLTHLSHPEVARALEQDFVWALVRCLADGAPSAHPEVRDRNVILARFEALLAENRDRLLSMSEICGRIGLPEQALRNISSQVLGMSPLRYQHLRRLKPATAMT